MLKLDDIFWVIPGVIFIHSFNKLRPTQIISLSGWPYVFFVVVLAAITWLPTEYILSYFNQENIFIQIALSSIASLILVSIAIWKPITDLIFIPIRDNFCEKCIEWEEENEFVILTLKNGKAYIGALWKYPENPRARHESQNISIIPIKSGYRDEKTKEVEWNINYPQYETADHLFNMEVIIPRSEIITFGKFSSETFKFFNLEKKQKNN